MTTIIHAKTRPQARHNTNVLKQAGIRNVKTIDCVDESGMRWHTQIVREKLTSKTSPKGDTMLTYYRETCQKGRTARNWMQSENDNRKGVKAFYKPLYRRKMIHC